MRYPGEILFIVWLLAVSLRRPIMRQRATKIKQQIRHNISILTRRWYLNMLPRLGPGSPRFGWGFSGPSRHPFAPPEPMGAPPVCELGPNTTGWGLYLLFLGGRILIINKIGLEEQ